MFRSGFKTTEFWVTLFATIGVFLAGLNGAVPPQYAIYLTTAIAVAYAASRGIAKYGTDLKRGWQTSEFWVGALTVGLTVLQTVQSNVPDKTVALVATIVTATIAAVRAFSKPTALADQFHPALQGGFASLEGEKNVDWTKDQGDDNPIVVDTPPTAATAESVPTPPAA